MEGRAHRSPPNNYRDSIRLVRDEPAKGYETEPVIVGGMVLDIHATPSIPANPRTTTPGKVKYILGGVARNIAECMSRLGTRPYMISAVGFDMAGDLLLEHWRSVGLPLEGILRSKDIETAIVCNIFDIDGELAAAVASVESIEKFLVPEWIQKFKSKLNSAPLLMVDANLSLPALEASCKMAAESSIPMWFEPVSVVKSRRVASVVNYVTIASPNEDELIAMANAVSSEGTFFPIHKDASMSKLSAESLFGILKPAICVLLDKGIKVLVVTLGSQGILLCFRGVPEFMNSERRHKPNGFNNDLYNIVNSRCPQNQIFRASQYKKGSSKLFAAHFPALPASVLRLTGAGDCLVGGALASICAGLDLMQSVAVGIATAKAAVEVETNVPAGFSLSKVADEARTVYFSAKVLFCQSML